MRRWLAGALVALAVLLLWLPVALPPILDDIYYRGPPSDHFDGERFFNPASGTPAAPRAEARPSLGRFVRFMMREGRAEWPASVAVTPARPPARVDGEAMRVTWVGHATVLVQTQGLNILTDPIWSDHASPLPPLGPRRARAPGIRFDDLPPIDLVLVSHNHYDHLDIATLKRLWQRDRPMILSGLGNDTLLGRAGIPSRALDWGDRIVVRPGITVIADRVHHWTSRWGADRNRALWLGFTVTLPDGNLFFAGDTGFGDGSWAHEAARHGPIRFAIIPIGAFLPREIMRDNHVDPAEAVKIFRALDPTEALGVHWGTFQLSNEAIDAPRELLAETAAQAGIAADRFRTVEAGQGWMVAPRR